MRLPSLVAGLALLSGCAVSVREAGAPPPPPSAARMVVREQPGKQYQWLHGSGEAAVLSATTYRAMARYVLAQAEARKAGRPVQSVVLAAGAEPDAPRWEACGAKPLAVVLDIDETSILNTGANYDASSRGDPPFDAERWAAWERDGAPYVEPLPGAAAALSAIRAAGVTPIFISNRETRNVAGAAAALQAAGLGPAVAGETMFLRDGGSGKDARRTAVAARWCVVAMAGDQLGDFSDAFNAKSLTVQQRRTLAQTPALAGLWDAGWFLLADPLYGPGVAGTFDDVFPAAKRWPGPAR